MAKTKCITLWDIQFFNFFLIKIKNKKTEFFFRIGQIVPVFNILAYLADLFICSFCLCCCENMKFELLIQKLCEDRIFFYGRWSSVHWSKYSFTPGLGIRSYDFRANCLFCLNKYKILPVLFPVTLTSIYGLYPLPIHGEKFCAKNRRGCFGPLEELLLSGPWILSTVNPPEKCLTTRCV